MRIINIHPKHSSTSDVNKDLDPKTKTKAKDLDPKAMAKAKNLGPKVKTKTKEFSVKAKAKDSRCQIQIFHWSFHIIFNVYVL